jgi:hypothetical protein
LASGYFTSRVEVAPPPIRHTGSECVDVLQVSNLTCSYSVTVSQALEAAKKILCREIQTPPAAGTNLESDALTSLFLAASETVITTAPFGAGDTKSPKRPRRPHQPRMRTAEATSDPNHGSDSCPRVRSNDVSCLASSIWLPLSRRDLSAPPGW